MSTAGDGNPAAKRSRNQEVVGNAVDRISDLPESVLLHILSFLPTLQVARTCILSRRWTNVWTCVPCLDFELDFLKKNFKSREAFVNFVNSFLLQYKGGSLKKVKINSMVLNNCSHAAVELWIRWAFERNVEELDLGFSYVSLHLPQTTLSCKNLKVFKLNHLVVSMTFPPSACIRCLKTLELHSVSSPDDEFENKLISCCRMLENLYITKSYCDVKKNIRVYGRQLKSLKVKLRRTPNNGNVYVIDVNAPTLQDLDVDDDGSYSLLLANVGNLSKAKINLNDPDAYQSLLKCFSALENVKFLCLSSSYTKQTCKLEQELTVHNVNLTRLTLGARSVWVQLLPYFFQCFPNLEVLRLTKDSPVGYHVSGNLCIHPELLPTNLLSRLRVFEAEEFRGTRDDLAMLKFILKNCKILEVARIQYLYTSQIKDYTTCKGAKAREFEEKFLKCGEERCELEQKFRVAQKIISFSKASQKCDIKFS